MKVLVLGATGMAGHVIAIYLDEQGHDVTAYSRRPFPFCENIIGEATEIDKLKRMITDGNYDAVINCIGILNQDAEDNKADAVFVNSYLPHFLSDTTRGTKTKIVHMSTDCVFSGKQGNYHEHSFKDGETFYDRSKALGEIENNKDLTFRNSIIGPDMNEKGIGLFNWFMKQEGEIYGYVKAIWTGVTTITLAKAMEKAIADDVTGLYNLVNNDTISKYDLLNLFHTHFRDNTMTIHPTDQVSVDKSLINNRNDFNFVIPSYEDMIIEMKEWVISHPELYPHYKKTNQKVEMP